ncbi:MAG: hypothetical protein QXI16_05205, partial [Sulfolobaceae archaeon]
KDVNGEKKRYTNYILELLINDKTYRVPVQPSTFGKPWTDPQVRAYFTLLDLVADVKIDKGE